MSPSSKKIPHIYFNNLDALRFFAAFAVILFHFSKDILGRTDPEQLSAIQKMFFVVADKGDLGVNFFFVLSGFLITFLILHEQKHRGTFNLKYFLIRRTLRIWPLYFIIVLIGFVIFPYVIDGYQTTHDPLMYILFLANFDEINHGLNDGVNFLTSPWSVAVEEQFYLFWGVLMLLLFQLKKVSWPTLLIILYLVSFIFRWQHWDDERLLYYHTLAVFQDIITGAFIGWSLFNKSAWLETIKTLPKFMVTVLYLLGFGLCIFKNKLFIDEWIVLERFVLSSFFAFIILDQIRGDHSLVKLGRIELFNFLGKISYGLYLYHLVVMYLLVDGMIPTNEVDLMNAVLYGITAVTVTILVAGLSYYLIEKPLLKLKPK